MESEYCLNPNVQWSKTVDCRKCHQTWIYGWTSAFTFTLPPPNISRTTGFILGNKYLHFDKYILLQRWYIKLSLGKIHKMPKIHCNAEGMQILWWYSKQSSYKIPGQAFYYDLPVEKFQCDINIVTFLHFNVIKCKCELLYWLWL